MHSSHIHYKSRSNPCPKSREEHGFLCVARLPGVLPLALKVTIFEHKETYAAIEATSANSE